MKNKIKPRRAIKCLDQNCDFHPKDLAAAMKKQEAVKPSPLPSEHAVLGRVLESVRDYLKKKDYELYREAMNEWENVAAGEAV